MAKKVKSKGTVVAGAGGSTNGNGNKKGNNYGNKKLVIVESPTKAKTIRKFLGQDYIVESCMGHIRDLPQSAKDIPEKLKKNSWANLGVNVENHFEPIYCIPRDKQKVVTNLKQKLESATELYLATDEDREGESISWHLTEVLKPKVPTKRMVFNEITKDAILKSLQDTRKIDFNLVRAQEARRILDRLVGYTISPLLWKKVAYGLSAGRVQSVAVRLICEREHERIKFKKAEYWGVLAQLNKEGAHFEAKLFELAGKKIATGKDFDDHTGLLKEKQNYFLLERQQAQELQRNLLSEAWKVTEVDEKPVSRKPSAPFITSTLQQEASRKLGLSSRETMQVAQKLYEQGFITYMRTDSTFLSQEAIQAARGCILEKFGKDFLPEQPRSYAAKKVKGAQEAHEAIRPAGIKFVDPEKTELMGHQLRLYEMIWKRTVASQMVDARQKQVTAKIQVKNSVFAAHGNTIEFPGFLRAYVEGSDDPEAQLQEREVRLPQLKKEEILQCLELEATNHETKPPARFTEASLIQMMEKEGIGRPSTYASILGTIVDRGYVRRQMSALVPTFTAMVVSKLLSQHLPQFVDVQFTSEMERSLDTIAEGDLDSEKYLEKIYFGKTGLKSQVDSQDKKIDAEEARSIHLPGLERYTVRVGKYGAYICRQEGGKEICASLPENENPADMNSETVEKLIDQKINGADALGKDPKTGLPVYALTGRYGPYVQLGDIDGEAAKPKRMSIPAQFQIEKLTLAEALELLSLPKTLGQHPGTKKDLKVGIGRFGPYIFHEGDYRSIPKTENVFSISLEKCLEILAQPKKGRGRAAPLKDFGPHPNSGEAVQLMNGPYGHYIKCGKINASIPEGMSPEQVSLEVAIQILGDKIPQSHKAKNGNKGKKAKTPKAGKKIVPLKSTKSSKVSKIEKAIRHEALTKK